jgi:cobalt-zinc-cadmium efflux system protein
MSNTHEHNHAGEIHSHNFHSHSRFRLVLVIIFNLIITIAEYIGGIISGSLALISDAGHNFSDVLSLILGYAGERVSERKSRNYTFGLKRFEVFTAVINALTLIGIGIYILYEAYLRFLNPSPVNIYVMLPVAFIGLVGNILSIVVLHGVKSGSLNLRAAFLHLLFDAVSSIGVIAAGVLIYFTSEYIIDIAVSLIIAVMIVWSSFSILKESFRIFLQGVPAHIKPDEVHSAIISLPGVSSLHGLHIWSISSNEVFLSCHICIEGGDGLSSDDIIKSVNELLEHNYGIKHTALQIEYENCCRTENGSCC